MALINANALREYYKINEHCAECHWYNRDCSKPPYYSLHDICEAIDEVPTINAIPVEWLKQRQDEAYRAVYYCGGNVEKNAEIMGAIRTVLELWQKEQEAQDG